MKPYKSIFKESILNQVSSKAEAQQTVDISNLEWGNTYKTDNWDSAESNCPSGWRLPTIQELYTAYVEGVEGFKSSAYWSSSTHSQRTDFAWFIHFKNGNVDYYSKTSSSYVRCVRDI